MNTRKIVGYLVQGGVFLGSVAGASFIADSMIKSRNPINSLENIINEREVQYQAEFTSMDKRADLALGLVLGLVFAGRPAYYGGSKLRSIIDKSYKF